MTLLGDIVRPAQVSFAARAASLALRGRALTDLAQTFDFFPLPEQLKLFLLQFMDLFNALSDLSLLPGQDYLRG